MAGLCEVGDEKTMQLYQDKGASIPQKLLVTGLEVAFLVLSAWILFGEAGVFLANWFEWSVPAEIPARRLVIFGFSTIIVLRMAFTMFYLMKRRMPWSEVFSVPFAFALYYVGFAILVLPSDAPIGLWDGLGCALFAFGCFLNTGSEIMRDRFKRDPANKGKLYTKGLFALSMHINFFGDILWVTGYAILAHSVWAWMIPAPIFCFFAFYNIPMLDGYLAGKYGNDFIEYAKRTPKLVPWIW